MATPEFKICLDAGHGNGNIKVGKYDPGACGGNLAEASVALDFVLAIKQIGIDWFGVKPGQIVLSRDDETDNTPVGRRDNVARESGCTHFLSVHCNASASKLVRGVETFYSEDKGRERSYAFAGLIQKAAHSTFRSLDRGIKPESKTQHPQLAVFDSADVMTVALLELGFISNAADRVHLADRQMRIWFAVKFWRDVMGLTPVAGPWAK